MGTTNPSLQSPGSNGAMADESLQGYIQRKLPNPVNWTDPYQSGLMGVGGGRSGLGFTHVKVALIGDSITARSLTASYTPPVLAQSAIAPWNWANAVLGAPFVFAQNLAVSGDKTTGIFSRISSVSNDIDVCFVMAGINDVIASLSSASIITNITNGVANLVAAGKTVVISTILPNNALTGPQVTVLNAVNAFIRTLASASVFVVDGFSALGGNVADGTATAGYLNADNTHPTAAGAQVFGQHSTTRAALTAAFGKVFPNISPYENFQQANILYNEFRRSTGGTAGTISAGSGTIADNWRCLQNAGTATFTVDASAAYAKGADFIGPWTTAPLSTDAYYQAFNVTAAAASDNPRLRYSTALTSSASNFSDGIFGGSLAFVEVEISVTGAVNLQEVLVNCEAFFTAGTSPADQPGYGTSFARAQAGSSTDSSSAAPAVPADYHIVWRTPVVRVPENINSTVAVTLLPSFDMKFLGAGSATVKFSRPRVWVKNMDRMA